MNTCIVWFRKDLRISDNPALHEALQSSLKIIPVYIHDPEAAAQWSPGSASLTWLHYSLISLQKSLEALGSRLIIRQGHSSSELERLIEETGADHVFWNRRYEPAFRERDTGIKHELKGKGLQVQSFNANLIAEPWEIRNQSGNPFQVFTPYWKHHRSRIPVPTPLPQPASLNPTPDPSLASLEVQDLRLLPKIQWDRGFWERFTPGEQGAQKALQYFTQQDIISNYPEFRNRPDFYQTSRLSPHLSFGEISPRQIFHSIQTTGNEQSEGAKVFSSEIGWREFAYHLIYHFPNTTDRPLKTKFESFPWESNEVALEQWKRGYTGIPIIDAGMRELWSTGWMHNRIRMIVGSFLVKNLLIPWQEGARWFWDTLVDADLASNTLGWQWVAGCGADAAPYFRIFNPVLQSQKFDPKGDYIRQWIPELASVKSSQIHTPWRDYSILRETGYPEKTVSLIESRNRALQAYQTIPSK